MRAVVAVLVLSCMSLVAACGDDDKPAGGGKAAAGDKSAPADKAGHERFHAVVWGITRPADRNQPVPALWRSDCRGCGGRVGAQRSPVLLGFLCRYRGLFCPPRRPRPSNPDRRTPSGCPRLHVPRRSLDGSRGPAHRLQPRLSHCGRIAGSRLSALCVSAVGCGCQGKESQRGPV